MRLNDKDARSLLSLTGGFALLVLVALALSGGVGSPLEHGGQSVAATALGDKQGVPPGPGVGTSWPDYTTCWIDFYGGAPMKPLCRNQTALGAGGSQNLYAGILSVDLGNGIGQSAYATRVYTPPYTTTVSAGAPICTGSTDKSGTTSCSCPTGYTLTGGGKASSSDCEKDVAHPATFSPQTNFAAGSAPTVGPGTSIALEWSCEPSLEVDEDYAGSREFGFEGPKSFLTTRLYFVTLSSALTTSGPGFLATALHGSQNVTAPTTPGNYTYTINCETAWGPTKLSVPITVISMPPPKLTITGNGQTGTITVVQGASVAIDATFTPGVDSVSGQPDVLTGTAINDQNSILWCGSGNVCSESMWTQAPIGEKAYTFTASAPGTYTFYPVAKTQTPAYANWNNYGQSLTITVSAGCQNGVGTAGNCTSCNSGFTLQGGQCVTECANGTGTAGNCSACDPGFTNEGGICVATSCVNGLDFNLYGPSCTCPTGQTQRGDQCVLQGSITGPLSANPSRVRAGDQTTLTWTTQNMTACSVTDDAGNTLSTETSSSGTQETVNRQTVYTLSCTDGSGTYTSSATVKLIPQEIEI